MAQPLLVEWVQLLQLQIVALLVGVAAAVYVWRLLALHRPPQQD